MPKIKHTIGGQEYTSLCDTCVHKDKIIHNQVPRTNNDVKEKYPTLDQYFCPTVMYDLVYQRNDDKGMFMDVAECDGYHEVKSETKKS